MGMPLTPTGRFSFADLFEPSAFEGQDPKYGVTLLFDADADLAEMKAAATRAAREKWGDKPPANMRTPFRDGNEKADLDGYAGTTFVRFTSKSKPGVVDAARNATTEVKSGDYGRVSYSVFAYDRNGNRGVSFGLGNVQKQADGEAFGGRTSPSDDFGASAGGDDFPF